MQIIMGEDLLGPHQVLHKEQVILFLIGGFVVSLEIEALRPKSPTRPNSTATK
jgi:hypothetical protein